jgi:hypothetical protein
VVKAFSISTTPRPPPDPGGGEKLSGRLVLIRSMFDALAKTQRMAKQKFRPTRPGGFSGAKAYIRYVEVLKKRRNAVGRTFCDAIKMLRSDRDILRQ